MISPQRACHVKQGDSLMKNKKIWLGMLVMVLVFSVSVIGSGGKNVPILYGGSANDKNCDEVFRIENVDGALVGGASLDADKFAVMVNWEV